MDVCKICLCSDPEHDISQLKTTGNVEQSGEYILLFCLGIQVLQGSGNTSKLCERCLKTLSEFHQFKSLALKNEATLSSLGLQRYIVENNIKHEVCDNDEGCDEPLVYYSEIQEEKPIVAETTNEFRKDLVYIEIDQELKVPVKQDFKDELSVNKLLIERTNQKSGKITKPRTKKQKHRQLSCVTCGKIFTTKHKLQLHYKTHDATKIVFGCDHCDQLFLKKQSLKTHIIKKHPWEVSENVRNNIKPELNYKQKCDYCDGSFSSQKQLREHLNASHAGLKPVCPVCNEHITEIYLKTHMKVKHDTEKTYQCDTCGKKFISPYVLRRHLSVHLGVKPFSCDICDAKFRLKYSVNLHKAQVHEKTRNHVCYICSKRYFTGSLLQRHIRKAHTDAVNTDIDKVKKQIRNDEQESSRKLPCPDCGKILSNKKTLKEHRYIHTGQQNHGCRLCDKHFTSRKYLLNHMLSHKQEKKFDCKYCTTSFIRSAARRRHELEVHLKPGEKKHPKKKRVWAKRAKKVESKPIPPIVTVTVPQLNSVPENSQILSLFPISGPVKIEQDFLCDLEKD